MSSHHIQFQSGMSISDFLSFFGSEAQCAEVLKRLRWSDGFGCPRCGRAQHCALSLGARKLF